MKKPKPRGQRVEMSFPISALESVFHIPEEVFVEDRFEDVEFSACLMYLAWQAHWPERQAVLHIPGLPKETKLLNAALFRNPKPSRARARSASAG